MPGPTLRLSADTLQVEPGGQVQTTVTITNHSEIVEGFELRPLGDQLVGWIDVTPPEVQIYPGQQATAVVVLSPPDGISALSGTYPFGVLATSVVDPESSAVAEGDVEVGRVFGLSPKLTPITSSGRWRGHHLATFSNWGNSPVRLAVNASDPDEKLAFLILPDVLEVPVGATVSSRIRVRTRRPFLRGTPVRLPFTVLAEPESSGAGPRPPMAALTPQARDQRASVEAAFMQKPILTKIVVTLATGLVLALGGGAAYALTRPTTLSNAELSSTAPKEPALAASAIDSDSIELRWQPQPRIDTYQLVTFTEDGRTKDTEDVKGALNTKQIDGLTPETTYCYELLAVRGALLSQRSDRQCVRTSPTPVTPPLGGTTGTDVVAPTTDVAGPVTQTVQASTPAPAETAGAADSPAQSAPGTPTPTGTSTSTSPSPTEPSTASTSGSLLFGPTDYIAAVGFFPASDPGSRGSAAKRRDQISGALPAGLTAGLLLSSDYADMKLVEVKFAVPTYVVYVGVFQSRTDVTNFCAAQSECFSAQPQPAG